MAQQLVNGSFKKGSVTTTIRMSQRYAVVGKPFRGKHVKPQTEDYRIRRRRNWKERNSNLPWVKAQQAKAHDEKVRRSLLNSGIVTESETSI